MINKLTYIEPPNVYPYRNLAVEEYLLLHCGENECILYLWQNQNTVVIGRNQNAWKECLVGKLKEEGGHLVRRLSGGGAVYHDLGNLNFTFLVRKENYDVAKQTQVILNAVKKLGINAEISGRNDVTVDGKKFSGHAYLEQGDYCYHHGTMMVNVDLNELSHYLTVSKDKLESNGVDSVKSRVTNLTEFKPDLTIPLLRVKLREAFEEVYGGESTELTIDDLDKDAIEERTKFFESWDWKFGRKVYFQYGISYRFDWGEVTIEFDIKNGIIEDAGVFSDGMKPLPVDEISDLLIGCRYDKDEICSRFEAKAADDEIYAEILEWLKDL